MTSSENCSEVKTFSGLGHVPRMSVVSVAESDANAAVADGQEIDQRLVKTGKVAEIKILVDHSFLIDCNLLKPNFSFL